MASVKKRSTTDGTYRYDVRYRTPDGSVRTKTFRRRRDADRYATLTEADKATGSYIDARLGETTFDAVAAEWLGTVSHLKPTTIAGYESILKHRLLPVFGGVPVAGIDTTAVKRFASRTLADGASYQTAKNALNVLRSVLRSAVESRYLGSNPADGVRLDRAKARRARADRAHARVYLTAEQVHDLADAMPAHYGLLVRFAAYSGLRAGELAGLQIRDLDMLRRRVRVERAVAEVHGALLVGDPKNGEPRTVSLPAALIDDVAAYLAATGLSGTDWLWSAEGGTRFRQSNFYRRTFRPVADAAEMPEGLRFHDLRHTCAALLIAQGAHPKAICDHLGHSSIQITMDTYGHLYDDVTEALAQCLDGVYRDAANPANRAVASLARAMDAR